MQRWWLQVHPDRRGMVVSFWLGEVERHWGRVVRGVLWRPFVNEDRLMKTV